MAKGKVIEVKDMAVKTQYVDRNKSGAEALAKFNEMIAVGDEILRATLDMDSLPARKLLCYALSHIQWNGEKNDNIIVLNKHEALEAMGIPWESNRQKNVIKDMCDYLNDHTKIEFNGKDKDKWESGRIVAYAWSLDSRKFAIEIPTKMMDHFEKLGPDYGHHFFTLYLADIIGFSNDATGARALSLYKLARQQVRPDSITRIYLTTRQIKELFGIPKDGKGSYMRDEAKGGFDRSKFEARVLDPVCKELRACKHIRLELDEDARRDKVYGKVKSNGYIAGYVFSFTYDEHPARIYTDTKINEITDALKKDPRLAKIAEDVIKTNGGMAVPAVSYKPRNPWKKKGPADNCPRTNMDYEAMAEKEEMDKVLHGFGDDDEPRGNGADGYEDEEPAEKLTEFQRRAIMDGPTQQTMKFDDSGDMTITQEPYKGSGPDDFNPDEADELPFS